MRLLGKSSGEGGCDGRAHGGGGDGARNGATARRAPTFHRSVMYGSYRQAGCLVEELAARGFDAGALDHRSPAATAAEPRNAFGNPSTPRAAMPAYGRKVRRLAAAVDRLPLSRPFPLDAPARAGRYDAVVIGSDEIWNSSPPQFCR
ncbi:hypothetical protein AB5I41_13430 [Sphingomonas sp. MMS24-JH45]